MKIYFGDANDDLYLFADGLFTVGDDQFYYGVEHGTNPGGLDEVSIFDGCNRSIPVHIEAIPQLIAALEEVQRIGRTLRKAQELTERAESDAEGVVEHVWDEDYQVNFDME